MRQKYLLNFINKKRLNNIEFPVLYGKNTKYLEIDGNGNGLNFDDF